MSQRLLPCPSCARHLRASEGTCHFCGASVLEAFAGTAPARLPRTRLNRAAQFAFGAVAATTLGVSGCGGDSHVVDDAGSGTDAGAMVEEDSGTTPTDAGSEIDAGNEIDSGNIAPPYGIPPDDAGAPPDDAGGDVPAYGAPPP